MRISAWASSLVFSAHAEVVPHTKTITASATSILRARGGSSPTLRSLDPTAMYSPRTRR